MTPVLDQQLRRWRIYKTLFVLFIAINIFSLTLSIVLGSRYFSSKGLLAEQQQKVLNEIAIAERSLRASKNLKEHFSHSRLVKLKTEDQEKNILFVLNELQNMLQGAQKLGLSPQLEAKLVSDGKTTKKLDALRADLELSKANNYDKLQKNLKAFKSANVEIVITGLVTLVFGVFLPLLMIYLMGRAMNRVRQELFSLVQEILKDWNSAIGSFGDQPFRNVEFWLQILLLVGSHGSRLSHHPVAMVSGELAHILRLELQKNNHNKTAA